MIVYNRHVDYFKVIRDYDKSQGRKPEDFDLPLKSSEEIGSGVDYMAASKEWENYIERSCSGEIHTK